MTLIASSGPDACRPARSAKATQAQHAYSELRRLILTTQLKPGQILREEALLQRLSDVGRTPLRDALRELAHDGLVEIRPRRGTTVAELGLSDLQQIFELRVAIESVIAQCAVRHRDEGLLRRLRTLVSRAIENCEGESSVDIDGEMHQLLVDMSGNRFLAEVYRRLSDGSVRLLYLTRCQMEPRAEQIETLRGVLAALETDDVQRLETILVRHVEAFRDRVRGALFNGTTPH